MVQSTVRKNGTVALMFLAGAVSLAISVQAKTVAWYRFEETDIEAVTKDTVFTNCIDASKFPMYAGVCDFKANNKYDKSKLVYTAEKMPFMTNGFSTVELNDPAGSCCPNRGSVSVNNDYGAPRSDPHAELFVDDDEALRLQTFTLEFFVRQSGMIHDGCMVCRAGGVYDDRNSSFRLGMTKSGHPYFNILYFSTVDGEPLYDANGVVTNATVNSCDPRSSSTIDFSDGKWHHVAIVADGAAKTVSFYADYQRMNRVTYTGDILYQPGYPLAFGGHPQSPSYKTAADFGEIRISDEALTPAQMLRYTHPKSQYASIVDSRTLLYFPFDGGTEPITVGAEMPSPITYTPYLANCAISGPFKNVDAQVKDWTKTAPADPQMSDEVADSAVRFGLRGTASAENAQSVHITTNGVEGCDYTRPIVVHTSDNMQQDLFGESCTFEAFFRMPPSGITLPGNQIQMFALVNAFLIQTREDVPGQWYDKSIFASLGDVSLRNANNDVYFTGLNDGKWHHVAFVYDKAIQRADIYFDYKWRAGVEDPSFVPAHSKDYYNDLIMGGTYHGNIRWFTDFRFDEVRVTRGALRPYEFLTTKACEGSDLAYAAFDGDYLISPYADFFTAATAVGGAFDADRPARLILNGKDGDPVRAKNAGSVTLSDGSVTWPGHDIVTDSSNVTAEFFVKTSVSGAPLLAVGDLWSLDSSLNLTVGAEASQPTAGADIADGLWHHVAVVFDGKGAKVYVDYESVLEHTFAAALPTAQAADLVIGGTGFSGKVDELRFTPSALEADAFLHTLKKGSVLILR